jgi:predicted Fe-Mo cluster-binding NifX family protein
MKTAFSVWDNRIAPVFDVARQLHIVDTKSGSIVRELDEVLVDDRPAQKAVRLAELGVCTLICGAISRQLFSTVCAYGISVIPFIAGDLSEVINAHLEGTIEREQYAMPGCHGRQRRAGNHGRRGPKKIPRTERRRRRHNA